VCRAAWIGLAFGAFGAFGANAHADSDTARLEAQIRMLTERVERLEQRNRALEEMQARTERSLATERLSENEPELVTRLKALEYQTSSMQKQTRRIDTLDGISVGASLTTMAQHVGAGDSDTGATQSRLGYRGDLSVTLPGGSFGSAEG